MPTTVMVRDEYRVETPDDIVRVRHEVKAKTQSLKFSVVNQTKLITASSELARNMLLYAGRGVVIVEVISKDEKTGVRITFTDKGPGIEDITLALTDGYTSGVGMGLGLGGSKRLVNEFEIDSQPGEGTTVKITRWV